jgi:hypothetical protein
MGRDRLRGGARPGSASNMVSTGYLPHPDYDRSGYLIIALHPDTTPNSRGGFKSVWCWFRSAVRPCTCQKRKIATEVLMTTDRIWTPPTCLQRS